MECICELDMVIHFQGCEKFSMLLWIKKKENHVQALHHLRAAKANVVKGHVST